MVRIYRKKTDEECRRDGLPTPLELIQNGIWIGPDTVNFYITYDQINQPDRLNPETSKEDVIVRTHR